MLAQLVRPGGRLARLTDPDKGEVEALRHRGSLWTPDRGPGFYQTQRARNAAPHLVTTGRCGSLPRAPAVQGTVMLSFLRSYSALLAEPYYHSWCDHGSHIQWDTGAAGISMHFSCHARGHTYT